MGFSIDTNYIAEFLKNKHGKKQSKLDAGWGEIELAKQLSQKVEKTD